MASFLLVALCFGDTKATEMNKSYTGQLVTELGEHKRTRTLDDYEGTHAQRMGLGKSRLHDGDSFFEWDTKKIFFFFDGHWDDEEVDDE